MRILTHVIMAYVVLFSYSVTASEADLSHSLTPATSTSHFIVNLTRGDISIVGYDGNSINITANFPEQKSDRTSSWESMFNVRQNNKFIELSTKKDEVFYSLVVKVPHQTQLTLRALDAKQLSIAGLESNVEISAKTGLLRVSDIKGSVVATVSNGRIVANLTHFKRENIYSFTLGQGDIDVNMSKFADVLLEIINHQGQLSSDFEISPLQSVAPGSVSENTYFSTSGVINKGISKLMLNSFYGDINLNKI